MKNPSTPSPSGIGRTPGNSPGGLLLNLGFNIIIPSLVLSKLSGENALGVQYALLLAIAFPLAYGIKDLLKESKVNPFSALGLVSVILTGSIGLLKLDPFYLAIKEASIPALLGLATLISLKTPYPLIKTLIYNNVVLDTHKVKQALAERNQSANFDRIMVKANYLVASSFFLSSFLNYMLARMIVKSPAGTEAFNAELGRMTALSYPVIAIPSMLVLVIALWYLFSRIHQLTGLAFEDILHHSHANQNR